MVLLQLNSSDSELMSTNVNRSDPSLLKHLGFWMWPCCLSRPLSTWSFTAFTGLWLPVNRALNSWLAPGTVLGISHLLHRWSTTLQHQKETLKTSTQEMSSRGPKMASNKIEVARHLAHSAQQEAWLPWVRAVRAEVDGRDQQIALLPPDVAQDGRGSTMEVP